MKQLLILSGIIIILAVSTGVNAQITNTYYGYGAFNSNTTNLRHTRVFNTKP